MKERTVFHRDGFRSSGLSSYSIYSWERVGLGFW